MAAAEDKSNTTSYLFVTALLTALGAFHFFGPLILVSIGLLAKVSTSLRPILKLRFVALWGISFAGLFYLWALSYGLVAWIALTLARGLPWILFALPGLALERLGKKERLWGALGTGVGLASVTWVLLSGLTGNDWESPANALAYWPSLLQILPWIGLVGFSFVIGLCSHLLVCGDFRERFAAVVVLGGLCLFGTVTLRTQDGTRLPAKVALVQTGWSQDEKWDKEGRKLGQQRLLELSRDAANKGCDLIFWPETAWPQRGMRRRFSDTRAIGKLARELGLHLFASSMEETEGGWFNSVSEVLADGSFGSEYRKRRLAPFAEYLPLPQAWEDELRKHHPFSLISKFLPGEEAGLFQHGGKTFALLICFESMTPQFSRQLAKDVDYFVVLTNDAPFGWDFPKEVHFRSSVLRAVEFGRPFAQVSNNGVTGFVSSRGIVYSRTKPGFSGPIVQLNETDSR